MRKKRREIENVKAKKTRTTHPFNSPLERGKIFEVDAEKQGCDIKLNGI